MYSKPSLITICCYQKPSLNRSLGQTMTRDFSTPNSSDTPSAADGSKNDAQVHVTATTAAATPKIKATAKAGFRMPRLREG